MIFVVFNSESNRCEFVIETGTDYEVQEPLVKVETDDREYMNTNPALLYLKDGQIKVGLIPDLPYEYFDIHTESIKVKIDLFKAFKAENILQSCRAEIVSGYESDALGQVHHYPSKSTDQLNMIASVADANNPENGPDWRTPFWCADVDGQWEFREHTATQIRRAGAAGKAAIAAAQLKNAQLQAQIEIASTQEEIEAITW